MGAPQVADAFLELLEKSELLTTAQIESAVEQFGLNDVASASQIAETLIEHGLLTRFQADRLLEGRYRGFFIEKYKAKAILGTGGMGWLYLAEDSETGNTVAVKMLPKHYENDPGMVARFKLEARAGMDLNHPNVIRSYAFDRTDGVYGDVFYVVMEFFEGISLEELINLHGPVPWPQACDYTRQAAAGLHHGHQRGLIHRDVKPANLLISRDGSVKVLDFGLSLTENDEEEFTLSMIFGHDCLGTADYISPEQSLDSHTVDGRADVYSLGCTLYVALTGKLPFPVKSTAAKLDAQRKKKPRLVSDFAPDVPDEVAGILKKMMAKKREDRFATALDVCHALSPFAERQPAKFDFQSILAARAVDAKRRIAAKQAQRAASDANSRTRDSSPSAVETKIRKDTQV